MNLLSDNKPSYVYLLLSTDNCTYIGATIDLDHRLRQHNKEIKGGARATSIKVVKGEVWKRVIHIEGFPDWKAALQFEWRWKKLSKKIKKKSYPIEKRLIALKELLALERPTKNAIKYSEWKNEPKIIFEDDIVQVMYES
jgi:structure-specific endonuclease subunit SLX1